MARNFHARVLICTVVVLAATATFYQFVFGDIFSVTIRWVSLLFLILAEIIGTCKILYIKKTIFGTANITASLIHIGCVIAVSLIFTNTFPFLVTRYIGLNVFMLCTLAIVDVILVHSGERIVSDNARLGESQAMVASCYEKAQVLCVEYRGGSYSKDLSEIAEMIKYCDNSVLTNDEIAILDGLEQLQGLLADDNPSVPEKITEIKNLIRQRSIKVASRKRGNY